MITRKNAPRARRLSGGSPRLRWLCCGVAAALVLMLLAAPSASAAKKKTRRAAKPEDKHIYSDSPAPESVSPLSDEPVLPEMTGIEAPEPVMEEISLASAPVPVTMAAPELPDGESFEPDAGLSDEPFDIQ